MQPLEPLARVGGFVDEVTLDLQRRHQQGTDVVLILDNENARSSRVI